MTRYFNRISGVRERSWARKAREYRLAARLLNGKGVSIRGHYADTRAYLNTHAQLFEERAQR